MKTAGYTLVELLVVVAIISVLGGIIIVNVGKFQQDGLTTKTLTDLQSRFSSIQAKAQTNQKCRTSPSLSANIWYGKLSKDASNKFQLATYCVGADSSNTEISMDTITLDSDLSLTACTYSLTDNNSNCQIPPTIVCKTTLTSESLQISFDSLSGAVKFYNSNTLPCWNSASKLFIDLKNTRTSTVKTITIDKGGVIN